MSVEQKASAARDGSLDHDGSLPPPGPDRTSVEIRAMSVEQNAPAARDGSLDHDGSLPPPGPERTSAEIRVHIERVLGNRARLQVQMEELRYKLQWLKTLQGKAVHKELGTTFGTGEIEVDGDVKGEELEDNAGDSVGDFALGGGMLGAGAESEVAEGEGKGRGKGSGRGRQRRKRQAKPYVKAPESWCQACWNEKRGVNPAVSHSSGKNGTLCRRANGTLFEKWLELRYAPLESIVGNGAASSNNDARTTAVGGGVSAGRAASSGVSSNIGGNPPTAGNNGAPDSRTAGGDALAKRPGAVHGTLFQFFSKGRGASSSDAGVPATAVSAGVLNSNTAGSAELVATAGSLATAAGSGSSDSLANMRASDSRVVSG